MNHQFRSIAVWLVLVLLFGAGCKSMDRDGAQASADSEIENIVAETCIVTGCTPSDARAYIDTDGDGTANLAEARAARRFLFRRGVEEKRWADAWERQWNLCHEVCRQIGLDIVTAHNAAVAALQHAGYVRDVELRPQSASQPQPATVRLGAAADASTSSTGDAPNVAGVVNRSTAAGAELPATAAAAPKK